MLPDRLSLLLTNDDGYNAEGLLALEQALRKVADVYVLAPDSNRSAVSNHIVMDKPLCLTPRGSRHFSCSGTPVDCVVAALHSDLTWGTDGPVHFDAVFSGINRGPNLGTDTVYSGTVAAARQAALYNLPGIALSLSDREGRWKYDAFAAFVAKNVRELVALCSPGVFVNVNAPSLKMYEKVIYSALCRRDYHDTVAVKLLPDEKYYSFFVGGSVGSHGRGEDSDYDFQVVEDGGIAVSLIEAEDRALPKPLHFAFSL